MRVGAAIAIAVSCVLGTAGHAFAQTQTFEQWFTELKQLAKEGPRVEGAYWVQWRVTDGVQPSSDELEALRAQVAAHPDHPDRAKLARWERAAAGHPGFNDKRIWIQGKEFRRSDNPNGNETDFIDCAVGDSEAWSLTPYELVVMDSRKDYPAGYPLAEELRVILPEFMSVVTGGLSYNRDVLDQATSPTLELDRWSCSAQVQRETMTIEFKARGTWNASVGTGTVDEVVRIVRADDGAARHGTIYRPSASGGVQFLDKQCPSEVTEIDALTGKPRRRVSLIASGLLPIEEFKRFIKTPALDHPDEVRGALTFRAVSDYRPGKPFRTMISADGAGTVQIPLPGARRNTTRWLEYTGWATAVVLVTGIVMLRLKRTGT